MASRKKAPASMPELDKVEKAIWKFLLKEGGLKDDHGYYGGMWMDRSSKSYKKAMEDKQLNTMHDVRSGDYTFTATAQDDWNRFVLHFTPKAEIASEDITIPVDCNAAFAREEAFSSTGSVTSANTAVNANKPRPTQAIDVPIDPASNKPTMKIIGLS